MQNNFKSSTVHSMYTIHTAPYGHTPWVHVQYIIFLNYFIVVVLIDLRDYCYITLTYIIFLNYFIVVVLIDLREYCYITLTYEPQFLFHRTGCDIAYGYLHRIPLIERGAEAGQAELEVAAVVPNAGQMPPASFAQMPPIGYPPQMLPSGGFVQMPQFPPGTYPVQMGFPMMPPPGAPGVSVSVSGGALDGTQHAPPQQMPQFVMPMSSQAPPFVPPSLAGLSGLPPPPAQSTPANKPFESIAPATSALNGPPPASSAPTSQPLPPSTTTSAAPAPPPIGSLQILL